MAAGDVVVFNTAKEWLADGTFDLDTNVFKLAICDNTTAPTATTVTPNLADFTEVGAAGTYVTGGNTLTCTWVESGGTVTFATSTTSSWLANGSNDTDAYWGIIYETGANNALAYVELGGPVDMSAGDLTINSGTIFTLA